jgi:hypothetical protein
MSNDVGQDSGIVQVNTWEALIRRIRNTAAKKGMRSTPVFLNI